MLRHRRLCLRAFDTLAALLYACTLSLMWATPAYAYVDPSVMTYAIQAFAGAAIALGAVFGVVWRRTRKRLLKLLHIDENAGKEIESPVHRVEMGEGKDLTGNQEDSLSAGSSSSNEPLSRRDRRKARDRAPLVWKKRIVYSLIVSAFLVFTILIVAPLEIVANNESSLLFSLSDIWGPVIAIGAVICVCLALLLSLIRGRAFDIVLLLLFALGLCAYVQVMFMNAALPPADGSTVYWNDYATMTVISGVVWILIIAIPIVIQHWARSACRGIATALSICLIVVQMVGVISLFVSPPSQSGTGRRADKTLVTEDGLFSVSPKNNVIVFVLDTFDTHELNKILATDPGALDEMTGFTYFENSTGSMIPTRYAVPFLLTGQLPQVGEPFSQYLSERYPRSTFLSDIHDAGYSIGVYSDTVGLEYLSQPDVDKVTDLTVNLHHSRPSDINWKTALPMLWQCALYRDVPWIFKSCFWFYTDEVNSSMVGTDASQKNAAYAMDDAAYYRNLVNLGLSEDDESSSGAFRFIHLVGAHPPYSIDANAQDVGAGNSDVDEQSKGTLKIVSTYLHELKELGVYDDSTIIVTADHGIWYSTSALTQTTSPIMLVKPAGSSTDSTKKTVTSIMPVSHLDFQATVMDAIGGDTTAYGTPMFDITDADRTRLYYMTTNDGKHDLEIKEISITGNALSLSGWQFTGNAWDAQS